ncbi:YchJ family protein [Vibrio salinus]|uniref:YchJ family protein n=1 Tax=Vibrio salinus TaxID=2899784 RepID=UPI001E3D1139|nr:YchJ family metal-binding protein [Vibrio salinus]MCE0492828.1 SEC-C domain-containing protein [Vibrio salinus]
MRNLCPCGSRKKYKNCCQPIHHDHSRAKTPEQLMRSRYSAYALGLTDYIINTYSPEISSKLNRKEIESGTQINWIKLSIKKSQITSENEGYVHFKAFYREQGETFVLEERSRFIRIDSSWYYVDGVFPTE